MDQVEECLPSKFKALISNPSTTKKKNKKQKNEKFYFKEQWAYVKSKISELDSDKLMLAGKEKQIYNI
jgi:hypothetical protein